jgi:hypothetical protein
MSTLRIRIEGETYLTFEAISQCYQCEIRWLQEVYETGLFGGGLIYEGTVVFHVTVLDRVAEVVRLNRYQGLGLDAIVVLLGDLPELPLRLT